MIDNRTTFSTPIQPCFFLATHTRPQKLCSRDVARQFWRLAVWETPVCVYRDNDSRFFRKGNVLGDPTRPRGKLIDNNSSGRKVRMCALWVYRVKRRAPYPLYAVPGAVYSISRGRSENLTNLFDTYTPPYNVRAVHIANSCNGIVQKFAGKFNDEGEHSKSTHDA